MRDQPEKVSTKQKSVFYNIITEVISITFVTCYGLGTSYQVQLTCKRKDSTGHEHLDKELDGSHVRRCLPLKAEGTKRDGNDSNVNSSEQDHLI